MHGAAGLTVEPLDRKGAAAERGQSGGAPYGAEAALTDLEGLVEALRANCKLLVAEQTNATCPA